MDEVVSSELEKVLQLFYRIEEREEEIKELRDETKDAVDTFCEEFDSYTPKVIKDAFRVYKNINKGKSNVVHTELQRDKIVEMLINR